MMHRPAGISDSDDSDDLNFISRQDWSFSHQDSNNHYSNETTNGFGFLAENSYHAQNGSINNMPNGVSRCQEGASSIDENGLSEKAVYLSSDAGNSERRPQPPYSSSNHRKAQRRQNLHRGVALPLEELRMAVIQGNLPVISDILAKGIAVDQTLKNEWTALMVASSSGKPDIVKFLLQKGADPNMHKDLFTALMAACASSHYNEGDLVECVQSLINAGAKVDAAEKHRMTPLMFASKEGRTAIVKCLLDIKASINNQDNKGWSALCWAATKGHGQIVRILLEHSADSSAVNTHGQRPSDIALAAGYSEIADVLDRACSKQNLEGDMEKLSSFTACKKTELSYEKCGDVEMILQSLELSSVIPKFQKHEVSMKLFLKLTEKDLDWIGVDALGARKKILDAVLRMNKQDWKTSSLPNLMDKPNLTVNDAVAMIANINKHLQFIHASVIYLRDQIQTTPRILEIGQEQHSVTKLALKCGESVKQLSIMKNDIYFFKGHLDKISDNVEFVPADVIINQKDDGRRWQRHLLASTLTVATLATAVWLTKPKIFSKLFSLYSYPQRSIFLDL